MLATVLIARRLYQEAKMELEQSRGNMGYIEKGLHLWKSRNAKEEENIQKQRIIEQFRANIFLHKLLSKVHTAYR